MNQKVLLFLSFMLLLNIGCKDDYSAYYGKYNTDNVVILVIDGPRYSETFGLENQALIPFQSQVIAPEGVLFTEMHNYGATFTGPGHVAICNGNYNHTDNLGQSLPDTPNIFQSFLAARGFDSDEAWIVSSKYKLDVLGNTTDAEWANRNVPSLDCGRLIFDITKSDRTDEETMESAIEILDRHHPKLICIALKGPDFYGHANDYDGYVAAIAQTDSMAHQIWTFINEAPEYMGKTTFIITNDHGRHLDDVADGFRSHGDQCVGCTHVSFFASGPDFKKGIVSDTPVELIDIAPTIAELIEFDLPTAEGNIITELFID